MEQPTGVQPSRRKRKAPAQELKKSEDGENVKQVKSRKGCLTCKAKRLKCDETKPSCQQCTRRNVECGGYKMNLKWKPFQKSVSGVETKSLGERSTESDKSASKDDVKIADDTKLELSQAEPTQQPRAKLQGSVSDTTANQRVPIPRSVPSKRHEPSQQSSSTTRADHSPAGKSNASFSKDSPSTDQPGAQKALVNTDIDDNTSTGMPDSLLASRHVQSALSSVHSTISPNSIFSNQQHEDSFASSPWSITMNFPDLDSGGAHEGLDTNMNPIEDELQQEFQSDLLLEDFLQLPTMIEGGTDADLRSLQTLAFYEKQGLEASHPGDVDQEMHAEIPLGSIEMMEFIFLTQTCNVLSIHDDYATNPWRCIIWPMAQESLALLHAICAMACFHLSKAQPELQVHGMEHIQHSVQALVKEIESNTLDLEVSLATNLAIAFAECWNHRNSITGSNYLQNARMMIREIISQRNSSDMNIDDLERLRFLMHTWLYLDVIARFTTSEHMPIDEECIAACEQMFGGNLQLIDPLMGCAATLFPKIGRVADLIRDIRTRNTTGNTPTIVSQATELRQDLESWALPLDLDSIEDSSSTLTDSIQISEAYRWAALLLLRQAVPEVPSRSSFGDIARKIFMFLATIPLASRTIIVQIFPLMAAGCEAQDEDRDWVRKRWRHMSLRMLTAITDRCLKITEEAWRRRDEYEAQFESGGIELSPSSKFPSSAAFKEGADPITRAGHIEYTVKGRLHWLHIMREWEWEVMLG